MIHPLSEAGGGEQRIQSHFLKQRRRLKKKKRVHEKTNGYVDGEKRVGVLEKLGKLGKNLFEAGDLGQVDAVGGAAFQTRLQRLQLRNRRRLALGRFQQPLGLALELGHLSATTTTR